MRERYGDAVRVNLLNGRGILVSSPELARQVFAADPDCFETGPVAGELFGQHSLLATSGAKHRRQRRLLNPRFHGPKIRSFLTTMQRVTRRHLEAFGAAASSRQTVTVSDLSRRLTLDIILETVFGDSRNLDAPRSRELLHALVHGLTPAVVAVPALRTLKFPPWRRFRRLREAFDAWVDSLIRERRAASEFGGDILGLLLEARYEDGSAMEDAEIRDQLMTLLLAGHETTAVTLAWGVYWLLREPAALSRLRAELDALGEAPSAEVVARQPFLGAVCSEALRIEPVVTDVGRLCRAPLPVGKWTVPPGENVFVNVAAILRDARTYAEPRRFLPERFLERSFGPGEFLPFGGGQRRCLGAAFAEAELAIGLACIAAEWELELATPEPEVAVRRNITMGPKNGVRVRIQGRRTPSSGERR